MKENQNRNNLMYQIKKSNLLILKKLICYNRISLKREVSLQIQIQTLPILTLILFQPGKKVEHRENPKVLKNHVGNVLRYSLQINPTPNLKQVLKFFVLKVVLAHFQLCRSSCANQKNVKLVSKKKTLEYFCMEDGIAQTIMPFKILTL